MSLAGLEAIYRCRGRPPALHPFGRRFIRLLGRTGPVTLVRVCDASCYVDDALISADAIKVDETNFSIDPLSSQGVQ